ncbi:tRNA lysidine(34) synthetase TilS [Tessaracoccus sp. OS52]|uniref:tRNA lysidine(34) synthetase TilS n=1 Tax=Tessaracoccus sp. OS52 TaxID=2886691 RepID=UPI001D0F514A|nr:tRNA lysidine(34) synthetase TilS [Tessaracoccus sp. OS52]MCC2594423.1 tRNA lysidine(34) synthetase TilS [Tessaracoccus sp. OS52]
MARRELGPAGLEVAQAVAALLPAGESVVGVSGGADSLALALGAQWAAARTGAVVRCVVVDHGLQPGSAAVADGVVATLQRRGLAAEVRRVDVDPASPDGMESAARDARLAVLAADGLPVLLGHTLDDQAESVLLGLLRGSGTRSLAGMAPVRAPFLRPLLAVRRRTTRAACGEWGVDWWEDPQNSDERFARVRVRDHLAELSAALGRDVAPALARSATLARIDADHLDDEAARAAVGVSDGEALSADAVAALPPALRLRVLRDWLSALGAGPVAMVHLQVVDALVTSWRGQGPVDVPGGSVVRAAGALRFLRS